MFTQLLSDYLNDDEYRELQLHLARDPEAGEVIQGTAASARCGGRTPRRGKGRRGGLRVIYFHFEHDRQIWFLTMYGKDEAADLTSKEKRALKAAIEVEKRQRVRRRPLRRT